MINGVVLANPAQDLTTVTSHWIRGPIWPLERTQLTQIFDLFGEDSQLNVYAGEREVRPPHVESSRYSWLQPPDLNPRARHLARADVPRREPPVTPNCPPFAAVNNDNQRAEINTSTVIAW